MNHLKLFFIIFSITAMLTFTGCDKIPGTDDSSGTGGNNGGNTTGQVESPVFSPSGGIYGSTVNVTISSNTAGASIFYTTNGTEPSTSSTPYTAPVAVTSSATIKAIAVKTGMKDSSSASAGYVIMLAGTVSAPIFSPAGGTFDTAQSVTISCATSGAEIYYTTNEDTPTAASAKYSAPIAVSSAMTIKAIGVKAGYSDSDVSSAVFSFSPAVPVITPDSGTFDCEQTVTITCGTSGSLIYYSTDGGNYQQYTAPITLNGSGENTVKAYSVKTGYPNSATVTKNYLFRSWGMVSEFFSSVNASSLLIDQSSNIYVACQAPYIYKYNGSSWEIWLQYYFGNSSYYYHQLYKRPNNNIIELIDATNHYGYAAEYNGSSWYSLSAYDNYCTLGQCYYKAVMDVDQYGVPYVLFQDNSNSNKLTVTKCVASVWQPVGTRGFAYVSTIMGFAVAPGGTPYATVQNSGLWVMKYDGTNWVYVGGQALSLNMSIESSIAVNTDGIPLVAHAGTGSGKLNVLKYDNINWVNEGNADITPGFVKFPILKYSPQGQLFVSCLDYDNGKLIVMKLNGNKWAKVGITNNIDIIDWDSNYCFAFDNSGNPYIAYFEKTGTNSGYTRIWRLNP